MGKAYKIIEVDEGGEGPGCGGLILLIIIIFVCYKCC